MTYTRIALKLNACVKKHRSLIAARGIDDAQLIAFFSVVTYRRILGRTYPFGELVIISNEHANGERPRIVWRSNDLEKAEDAINQFIRALKLARGEK